jgi:large subunit ribosomal protein L23
MSFIIKPLISEKMNNITEKSSVDRTYKPKTGKHRGEEVTKKAQPKYGFIVKPQANKIEIAKEVEALYNVTVENVNTIRTNHISVSRYITQHIPQDGIIDLTGKIPTPLSRDRYEIWVNGRQVYDDQHITILSPTTFQLRNMISLKNLEVIELIDDVDNTILTPTGPVYIDIDGAIYTSYIEMMKHHANLIDQSVHYYFNQTLHSDMDTYVIEPYRNPNNKDYEEDILNYLTFDDTIMSYDELHNIPTINGNDVRNMTSETIGFMELPNDIILHMFDDTCRILIFVFISHFKHINNQSMNIGLN